MRSGSESTVVLYTMIFSVPHKKKCSIDKPGIFGGHVTGPHNTKYGFYIHGGSKINVQTFGRGRKHKNKRDYIGMYDRTPQALQIVDKSWMQK